MRLPTRLTTAAVAVALLLTAAPSFGRAAAPDDLSRATPESQGVSSAGLLAFVEAADARLDSLHGFVLMRHGKVVAEGYWSPYDGDTHHTLFSLTKSFTSTAVGFAVSEGKVRIEDPVLPYFPDDAPADVSANLRAMRVRDLLTMSTGQHAEAQTGPRDVWTRNFLAEPVVHKPGTYFLYNTPGSYMLSAIVQKATGQTELDYLKPRLFEPLGITSESWLLSPQGVSIGGYGLKLRTREIARFGQTILQNGMWNGKQVIPAAWVEAATSRQMSNGSNPDSDWDQGYGFQFWRCRHDAFRGDGAFGQFCIVMPEQDAVLAINSGIADMQSVLNAVWDYVLPALKGAPLPDDAVARVKLENKLASLRMRGIEGSAAPTVALGRRYAIPANDRGIEEVGLEAGPGKGTTLVLKIAGVERRIPCGAGEWTKSGALMRYGPMLPEQPVAATGAWISGDTFRSRICFLEEPFLLTTTVTIVGDRATLDVDWNVNFGPTHEPQLAGVAR